MDAQQFFTACTSKANEAVLQVQDNQWHVVTPCSEWDMLELVKHMLYELAWVPSLLAGKTIAEVGDKYDGNLIGANLLTSWGIYQKAALQAVAELDDPARTVHLSYGDVPARDYIVECAIDMLVHGWDVAQAAGLPYEIEESIARVAYEDRLPRKDALRASAAFAAPVPLPDNAPLWHKMLGLYGRQPR